MDSPDTENRLLDRVHDYHMPEAAQAVLKEHPPLVIAGISASGKNSATRYIAENSNYRQVVTHTTRQPRAGEVQNQHYHFVDAAEMLRLVEAGEMVEVHAVHGSNVYGVSIEAYRKVITDGHEPLLIVDVQGVEDISKHVPVRPVFLLPPDFDTWMRWLEKRGRMSHTEKLRRMHSAREELQQAMDSDRFFLLINQDIVQTAQTIMQGSFNAQMQHRNRETAQLLLDHLNRT